MKYESGIPQHVAIIMDGNGRWAQRRGRPRLFGHVRGSARVKTIVREADRLGIRALTLYAFSTENWSRPEPELQVLWKLLKKFLKRETEELHQRNVRLRILGEVERLSPDVREIVDYSVGRLSGNTGLQLNFAISYGSRAELMRAARMFAEDCQKGLRDPSEMNEKVLGQYLWTGDLGAISDVDLMIRTSGEKRISNFLLWQAAYAEFLFTDRLWPDFGIEDFHAALSDYGKRERRFGKVGSAAATVTKAAEERILATIVSAAESIIG